MEAEQFFVEEFFDFPNGDDEDDNAVELSQETTTFDCSNNNNNKVDASVIMAGESSSATELADFSAELCLPYDDFPELEWLSTLTEEESFSSEEDMEKLQLITGSYKAGPGTSESHLLNSSSCKASHVLRPEVTVPAKARTKRPRPAPCNWSSPFLVAASPPTTESQRAKRASKRSFSGSDYGSGSDGRKCLHCASEKTPQWRTGPMGPKTLCNACGVRYKSGRLVPEYRPAASPTFVLTRHSNSHRKVIELRRQKEMMRPRQQQYFVHGSQSMAADGMDGIGPHVGLDFRQLI